mgnify:CR=1 FL=1
MVFRFFFLYFEIYNQRRMKKIIAILGLMFPVLAFGQVTANIGVSKEMKTLKVDLPKKHLHGAPFYQPWNGRTVGFSQKQLESRKVQTPIYVYRVNGDVVDQSYIYNFKREDIKSLTFVKDGKEKEIYGNSGGTIEITLKPEIEYEATVLDVGFESFLATQKSISFYSEATLKSKNALMVTEWNSRHGQPLRYNPNIYEVNIDYDPSMNYGLGVEYTLYMFFKFMEKEHRIKLS